MIQTYGQDIEFDMTSMVKRSDGPYVLYVDHLEEIKRIKSVTWCAYCGHEITLDDEAATKIGEHIMLCEKHPIHVMFAEITRLTAEVNKISDPLEISERLLPMGFVVVTFDQWEMTNKDRKALTAEVTRLRNALETVGDEAISGSWEKEFIEEALKED